VPIGVFHLLLQSLNIRIVPVSMSKEGKNTWNEAEYQVFRYNN